MLCREEDSNIHSYTPLPVLRCAHGHEQLPFVFEEMEGALMSTFNIKKPVLEIINLEYSFTTIVGQVIPVPSTI